jgi:hypothetical protein
VRHPGEPDERQPLGYTLKEPGGGHDLMARPNPEKKPELETPAQQLWDARAELEALTERLAVSFDLVAALLIRHVSTHR